MLVNRIDDQQMMGRKERRLAAINKMNTTAAARDKPIKPSLAAPDAEMQVMSSDGDLDIWATAKSTADDEITKNATALKLFRTVAEAQEEDDDDDLFNF